MSPGREVLGRVARLAPASYTLGALLAGRSGPAWSWMALAAGVLLGLEASSWALTPRGPRG